MKPMVPIVLSALAALVLVAVLSAGLRAARTRTLALWGLIPAGCTLGAGVLAVLTGPTDLAARIALSTVSMAAGIAHGVVFSVVALPARRTWLRTLFVPVGMWTGTFAAMWFAIPYHTSMLLWLLLLLASGTVTAWILLPFWSRNRGFVERGERKLPSVRFACPRCGTRVDWHMGVAACTDCGLFLHVLWPADELHAEEGHPRVLRPRYFVRFRCPQCGSPSTWPRGDSACGTCGLKLSLHWNVHGRKKEISTPVRERRSER
jgi:transcription elongation factor Elf1